MSVGNSEYGNKWCSVKKIIYVITLFVLIITVRLLYYKSDIVMPVMGKITSGIIYLAREESEYIYNRIFKKDDMACYADSIIYTEGACMDDASLCDSRAWLLPGYDMHYYNDFSQQQLNYEVNTGILPVIKVKNDSIMANSGSSVLLDNIKNDLSGLSYKAFVESFYTVDSSTRADKSIINPEILINRNCSINGTKKILIYHTHGSEAYADSCGSMDKSVIGVGDYLEKLLLDRNYEVIHLREYFDRVDGRICREGAYERALIRLNEVLAENPDINVIIDLHRDSGERRVAVIDSEPVAKLMLFNGLSYDGKKDISSVPNPNREGNLAFSLQLKTVGDKMYEGLFSRIYVRNYRYNMHLTERAILLETGTDRNSFEEACKAMDYFADVLGTVLE